MTHVHLRGVKLALYQYEAVSEAIRQAGDFYEAAILDELRERLPWHRTIVDAGANIGNHSAYWSAFVPHDRLLAFEPIESNYRLLCLNVAGNARATCYQAALSDKAGHLQMQLDEVNMGRSRIVPDGPIDVRAMTLDSLRLRDVTLLKIDTEGHELRVLAGALRTIARCHPAILVEDESGRFGEGLAEAGFAYRETRSWPGANHLWEWA